MMSRDKGPFKALIISKNFKGSPVKMAVPAQVLRYRGAGAASELARAGTIEFGLGMLSCDETGVWAASPS
jgi:hypothetical protein